MNPLCATCVAECYTLKATNSVRRQCDGNRKFKACPPMVATTAKRKLTAAIGKSATAPKLTVKVPV